MATDLHRHLGAALACQKLLHSRLVAGQSLIIVSDAVSFILDPYIRSLSPALYTSAIWRDADKPQIKYV